MQTNTSRHGIRWNEVAEALGGNLVTSNRDEAQVYVHRNGSGRRLILTDNGGEVNVSEIVSATPSVPYVSGANRVGPMTLAHRILTVLDGEAIDFEFSIDDEEVAP
jgi:hypothetical protein